MYALGLTIDSRTKSWSEPWFACFAYCGSLPRSGPIVPVDPAGWNAWQPPQPVFAKTGFPAAAFPGGAAVVVAVGIEPTTFLAVGCTVPSYPHATSSTDNAVTIATRRMARESNGEGYHAWRIPYAVLRKAETP